MPSFLSPFLRFAMEECCFAEKAFKTTKKRPGVENQIHAHYFDIQKLDKGHHQNHILITWIYKNGTQAKSIMTLT